MLKVDLVHKFQSYSVEAKFELMTGQSLGLFGKSGIGKSTVLRAIAGLVVPNKGEITFNGAVWTEDQIILPTQERHVGLVFQDFALFPNMTVEENLRYAQQLSESDFDEILDVFDIRSILPKKANFLSGGQRQRTAIGRALIYNPKILLLDEPFSALDDDIKSEIKKYLKSFVEERNKSAIIASHDLEDLTFFTDDVLRMTQIKS